MKINLPSIRNIMPSLRGLNLWTLKQKVKDHTVQRTSTIQLLQKIDIYRLSNSDRAKLLEITNAEEQQVFIKSHGVLDRTTGEMKSHSFVFQFIQWLEVFFAHKQGVISDAVSIKDASANRNCACGSVATNSLAYWFLALESISGDTTYGILVGTGTTTPATLDYKMQTLTAHGSSANQLQYSPCSVGSAGVNGANADLVISRILVNVSGGTITLKEVGIVAASMTGHPDNGPTVFNFMLAHDAVNQAIANTEIAVVTYVIRTTV